MSQAIRTNLMSAPDTIIQTGPPLPSNLSTNADIQIIETIFASTRWDDATWILTSAFIIFTMQSGFGLLESGSASQKNEVNIMVKNAIDVLFGGLSYWSFGYGFSFGHAEGTNAFIGYGDFFLDANDEDEDIGHLFAHFFFHASFATTATTIVSGAMAERTKLEAYIVFSFVNTFIYVFPAHWMWAENGWLKTMGAIDIAGAGAVHLVGGVTGLVATLMMKPRTGRFKDGLDAPAMGSPTNAIFGMFMLWWGWLGFNCGSTYGITQNKWILAAKSAVLTITSSVGGGVTGILLSYVTKRRKLDVSYLINGVLGSLVAVCALCAVCRPWEGLVIGSIGGLIACGGCRLTEKLRIDDPVGVVPVHMFCGIWGLLSVGLFADKDELDRLNTMDGLFSGGGWRLFGVQLLAVLVLTAWTAFWSAICFKLLDLTIGLRVPLHEEILGADIVEHSLNGSYDGKTGEWKDIDGKLLMVIKKDQPIEYYNAVKDLLTFMHRGNYSTFEFETARKSAFGFLRNSAIEERGDFELRNTMTNRKSTSLDKVGRKLVPRRRLLWRKNHGVYTVNKEFTNNVVADEKMDTEAGTSRYEANTGSVGFVSITNQGESRNKRSFGSSPVDGLL